MKKSSTRLKLDPFVLALLCTVAFATVLPVRGEFAHWFNLLTDVAVGFLFFVHGAILPREAVIRGLTQWRLHFFIFAITFGVFPLAATSLHLLPASWLPSDLLLGFLYLGALPSAVSSSIAFTAGAKGNVPAAVCSAAASSVFGMVLTPVIFTFLAKTAATATVDLGHSLISICTQLLLPFLAGQVIRPWLAEFLNRHKSLPGRIDKSVIVMVVYGAFSQSVVDGLWQKLPLASLLLGLLLCLMLLLTVLGVTTVMTRFLGFSREDEIAAVFCGSKKSLASGLPFAKVLFAGAPGFGMIVLPIMFYNQLQIFACALLAQRYASRQDGQRGTAQIEPLSAVGSQD